MKILKIIAGIFVALFLVFVQANFENIKAQGMGAVLEATYHTILNTSGAAGWRVGVDSSNNLTVQNLDTAHAILPQGFAGVTIDKTTQAIKFPGYTTTQLQTLAAPASGYMVWNINAAEAGSSYAAGKAAGSGGRMSISTGTGLGAWTTY